MDAQGEECTSEGGRLAAGGERRDVGCALWHGGLLVEVERYP